MCLAIRPLKHQLAALGVQVDPDGGAVRELSFQKPLRQRVVAFGLQQALQRPRAVERIVALVAQIVPGPVGQFAG